MSKDFKVDVDSLEAVKTKYITYLATLETSLTDAKSGLDELRGDKWQGKSKDAFFEESFEDWNKGIEKQIEKLKVLTDLLVDAETEFSGLSEEGKKLSGKFKG